MEKYIFEFVGTMIMMFLGNSVCASNSLEKSKGKGGGWIVVTLGWGFAVMCGVFIAGPYSGAHLNPAVTLGFALSGKFAWADMPGYVVAQMLGGFCGALLAYTFYKDHFDATEDGDTKLGVFCTMPAIPNLFRNFLCEVMGTFVLVFIILVLTTKENTPAVSVGDLGVLPVTMLIMMIGMSLGGATGYAINPARDLGPRIVHEIAPMKSTKRDSGWSYSWIPVVAPLAGSVIAAGAFLLLY